MKIDLQSGHIGHNEFMKFIKVRRFMEEWTGWLSCKMDVDGISVGGKRWLVLRFRM